MKEVKLGRRAAPVALVDDEDAQIVGQYRWYLWNGRYARRAKQGADSGEGHMMMHNLIMGTVGVDHRNGDGLDNRRANLRVATQGQNCQNRRKRAGCTSRFKGVTRYSKSARQRPWMAQIRIDGAQTYLGIFATEEDAARAYDTAAATAWGEFACLNFPVVAE